jgi:hypothetical protein
MILFNGYILKAVKVGVAQSFVSGIAILSEEKKGCGSHFISNPVWL